MTAALFTAALAVLCACACAHAAGDDGFVEVDTTAGTVRGFVSELNGARAGTWQGIPFAEPPVGDLRWRPPVPAANWSGVLNTTDFKHNCLQNPGPEMMGWAQPLDQLSEDCLYLNVYAPLRESKVKPCIALSTRLRVKSDVAILSSHLLLRPTTTSSRSSFGSSAAVSRAGAATKRGSMERGSR